ncbi:MAG: PAS domain-containing protein [Bacillota bacterium]
MAFLFTFKIFRRRNDFPHSESNTTNSFENNPDAFFDLDRNYLSVNRAMEQLLGYSVKEFLQMSYIPIITPDEIDNAFLFQSSLHSFSWWYDEISSALGKGTVIDLISLLELKRMNDKK